MTDPTPTADGYDRVLADAVVTGIGAQLAETGQLPAVLAAYTPDERADVEAAFDRHLRHTTP